MENQLINVRSVRVYTVHSTVLKSIHLLSMEPGRSESNHGTIHLHVAGYRLYLYH